MGFQLHRARANAYRSSELITRATRKVYSGEPHALIATAKDQVNADSLALSQAKNCPIDHSARL